MTEDAVRQEIMQLEAERIEALTSGDVAALSALMAEDLVHIHGNGHVDGKADYLDGVATKYRFHRITRGDLSIRVYGDVVMVNGPLSQSVSINGIDKINEISAVATQSWIRTEDGWRQSTCHMGFLSIT
ncbi:MAG: nuclear transport factor 2 family protein [Sphingobium sp.]